MDRIAKPLRCLWLLIMLALGLGAVELSLDPPGEREFICDPAGMIDGPTRASIQGICSRLLSHNATPIIVVAVESMSAHGGDQLSIETFAKILFDQWGIGQATVNGQDWNTGILLLVSRQDRQARIELGAGWGRREDALCRTIMADYIVPQCRSGRHGAGILAGVEALDRMARKLSLPEPPRPWWYHLAWMGGISLGLFTIVSLILQGPRGWAWLFWGLVFSLLGSIIAGVLTSRGRSGRSFGGGSFGGGFSGGGGATGSW
jgi:uncharacterized protein